MIPVAPRTSASPHWQAATPPRIELGALRDIGLPAWAASRILGWFSGGRTVRAVDAIAISPRMFWGYVPFAFALVPLTRLPRAEIELATLRTAWNAGVRYEWLHHVYLSRLGGLSPETVERASRGPDAEGWTARQRAVLTAVDELHADRFISDGTWARLREFLDQRQIVELCFLVGHYEMLAMLLKSVGVEPEPGAWQRGPLRFLRRSDDSDALMPRFMPAFNRAITNRITGVFAGRVPPYALIHHRGRRSGRAYRTPVLAFRDGDTVVVPLPYGDRADWVRNLLAAGGGEIEQRGRASAMRRPRILDGTQSEELALPGRLASRLVKVLVAELVDSPSGPVEAELEAQWRN